MIIGVIISLNIEISEIIDGILTMLSAIPNDGNFFPI